MCCDGSLFDRVPLEADELEPARRHRLRVLPSGNAFEQPCAALDAGRCAVYEERPRACRRFRCRLYAREGASVDERMAVVRSVRALVARLESYGLGPEDLERSVRPEDQAAREDYRELTRMLENDFARADGSGADRQDDGERRALARPVAGRTDLSAVQLHDVTNEREPQP